MKVIAKQLTELASHRLAHTVWDAARAVCYRGLTAVASECTRNAVSQNLQREIWSGVREPVIVVETELAAVVAARKQTDAE